MKGVQPWCLLVYQKKTIVGVGLELISVMMTARVFVSEYLQGSFACWSHGYHTSFSLAKIVSATAIRNGSGPAMVYPGLPKKKISWEWD
jgi:hypothetical protein